MTLRERIESYVESLGGEMDGFELTQDGLRAVLDAVLTETVIADTERDRLARIGELVEKMHIVAIMAVTGQRAMVGAYSSDCTTFPQADWYAEGTSLLDALEALKQKTEGL